LPFVKPLKIEVFPHFESPTMPISTLICFPH
jgi:hypothetical protein